MTFTAFLREIHAGSLDFTAFLTTVFVVVVAWGEWANTPFACMNKKILHSRFHTYHCSDATNLEQSDKLISRDFRAKIQFSRS